MKRLFITSLSILGLSACASIIDKQTHMVTMKTPGAENARCVIENQDMKYVAYSDETIEIMKSPHDLAVRCAAPGNRVQTVHVKREVNGWVFANVANGFIPGATYDYFSRGAFDYPDIFTVSFVGAPVKPYDLPAYHAKDVNSVHQYGETEYMGPTVIVTEKDKGATPYKLQKRDDLYGGNMTDDSLSYNAGGTSRDLDSIHRQYNPASSYDPSEEDK